MPPEESMLDLIVRSILIGGALGLIGTWFLDIDPLRAVGYGLMAGFLAGLTRHRLRSRRRDE
jgi:hypothetical protein